MNISVVAEGVGLENVVECIFSEETTPGSLFNCEVDNATLGKVSGVAEIKSSFVFSFSSLNTPGLLASTEEVADFMSLEEMSDNIGSPTSLGVSTGI